MPSFDIVNKIDFQKFDNAVNTANKEIGTRFDFKGSDSEINLDQKNKNLQLSSGSELKMDAIVDILLSRMIKQGLDPKCLDLTKDVYTSGKTHKKDIPVKDGIDKENAKKVVKLIKDSGLKVQAAIMDDIVRVSAKKIDDLQTVITMMRNNNFELPLQFVNMKS